MIDHLKQGRKPSIQEIEFKNRRAAAKVWLPTVKQMKYLTYLHDGTPPKRPKTRAEANTMIQSALAAQS